MSERERLRKAIRDLHGVESRHAGSVVVRDQFRGEVTWERIVEVFSLRNHPKATSAYAWSHQTDDGGRRYVAVLQVPPVRSPLDAVRASIAAEAKARR